MAFRMLNNVALVAFLASSVAAAPSLSLSTSLCNELRGKALGSKLNQQLCATAHAQAANTHILKRGLSLSSASQADVQTNAFVGAMNACNSQATSLSATLNNVLKSAAAYSTNEVTAVVASATNQAEVLAQHVNQAVNAAVTQAERTLASLENAGTCTDAAVAAATYKAFGTFVANQQKLLAFIAANGSLWNQLNVKEFLHASLLRLQSFFSTYNTRLFTYISQDLDHSLNLRGNLLTSVQAAIDACA